MRVSERKLTPKQEQFAQEYLIDLNATQAAIRAGYSQKTAGKIGFQLLEKTRVQAHIAKLMQAREQRTEISQDMVIEQLAKIAFADLKDFVSWNGNQINIRPSDEVDGTLLAELSESVSDQGRILKVKRHDSMKALELLGRHLGMFKDKVEMTGANGEPLSVVFNMPRPNRGDKS